MQDGLGLYGGKRQEADRRQSGGLFYSKSI
jgi:hypothetical protein